MKRYVLLLALMASGCTAQSESMRMSGDMVLRCQGLGGAPKFEHRDGVAIRFTCQLGIPSLWINESPRQ